MMRWTPNATADVSEVSQDRGPVAVQALLDAVVDVVARMGGRSVLLGVMVALVVLTLVFGLSVDDALAGANYCRSC